MALPSHLRRLRVCKANEVGQNGGFKKKKMFSLLQSNKNWSDVKMQKRMEQKNDVVSFT